MRVGGWMRLWIVLCVAYGMIVALVESLLFPAAASQVTYKEFNRELSDTQAKLVRRLMPASGNDRGDWIDALPDVSNNGKGAAHVPPSNVFDQFDKPIDPARVVWDEKMPDGFRFGVVGTATESDREALRQAWNRALNGKLSAVRRQSIQTALLVWLIPCLALLALGEAVAWVRRGFYQSGSSS